MLPCWGNSLLGEFATGGIRCGEYQAMAGLVSGDGAAGAVAMLHEEGPHE